MPERLTPLDVSFLYLEEPTTAMHVGSVMIFQAPAEGFDYERLSRHVGARIAFVPRYRQRIRWVPGRLGTPVWVDDESFDVTYHIRRSALPRPGSDEQLRELVARVQARHLDRNRPLWEVYLVEGLSDHHFAILTKTHQALVDGVNAVDLGQVVLDDQPVDVPAPPDTWRPAPEPSLVELVTSAVMDTVRRPGQVVDTVRAGLGDIRATAEQTVGALGSLAVAARTATRPAPASPLNVPTSEHRRFAMVHTDLEQYRRVRSYHARGQEGRVQEGRVQEGRVQDGRRPLAEEAAQSLPVTVNDVMLATLTGALRSWLLTRAEPVAPATVVRALVPVSVRSENPEDLPGGLGGDVAVHLVDLPVGEPSPVLRLHQVAYQMRSHSDGGQAVGAQSLAGIAGFAPPTLHSLGARVASGLSRRLFNVLVTNVPGPQRPLYAAGARMLASYPVVPLARGQGLAIGITSYDGRVYYGLNADRDGLADVDVLVQCVLDAIEELEGTVR